MKLRPARPMWSTTFTPNTLMGEEGRKDQRRVHDWAVRNAAHDVGAHAVAVAAANKATRAQVSAVFSRTEKRTFVEQAGLLTDTALVGAGLHVPSECANSDRQLDATRLMHIETARQLIARFGDGINGLYIAQFLNDPETGRDIDRGFVERQTSIYEREGLKLDEPSRLVRQQVEHAAVKLMPGLSTWRPEFELYFASPERLSAYRGEGVLYDEWLNQIVGENRAELHALSHQTLIQGGAWALRLLSGLYRSIADEAARRIETIRIEASREGPGVSFGLRMPPA